LNKRNILITGGAGFIGSNFIKYYLNKHDDIDIINLDALTYSGSLKNLGDIESHKRYNFIHGDICDKSLVESIFNDFNVNGVINFAAETHVDNSIVDPEVFIRSNVNGVFNLLNIAYKYWMDNPFKYKDTYSDSIFYQISTDEVYGSILKGSFNEESNLSPNSPYAASKASADMLVRSYNKTFGLNTIISRSSNNFGPNQHFEKYIPMIICNALDKTPISVYGSGNNVRDWIYVLDHCRAIDLIFDKKNIGEIFNISSGNEITNNDLMKKIFMLLGEIKNKSVEDFLVYKKFVEDRPGHDFRYSVDNGKLKRQLNWNEELKFDDNLKSTISYYLKYEKKIK
tara:strand:+ start:6759 stop:7781 length:1023 start_codon:yes stop_codon:yes gene_type:complete